MLLLTGILCIAGSETDERDYSACRQWAQCLSAFPRKVLMNNFPHQFARIASFSKALQTYVEAAARGVNVLDDGEFGIELARNGVYRFRRHPQDLEQRIAQELQKPQDSQGMRTAAREMRKTFHLLGLIDQAGNVTELGRELRQEEGAIGEGPRSKSLWRFAFWTMCLNREDYHPYQIMLRLVREHGPLEKYKLSLSLEAQNDSDQECDRIVDLLHLDEAALQDACGASEHQLENAVKVLPPIAEELGDLQRNDAGLYRVAIQETELLPTTRFRERTNRGRTRLPRERRTAAPAEGRGIRQYFADTDQQANRRNRHEALVNELAACYANHDPVECPGGFDLMVSRDRMRVLFEVKTIEGDQHEQVLAGTAQLLYYRYSLRVAEPDTVVKLVLVVDNAINQELKMFLTSIGIGLVEYFRTTPYDRTALASQMLEELERD